MLRLYYILNTVRGLCFKRGIDLYVGFIDITKAYDTVDRDILWTILAWYGIPPLIIDTIKRIYAGSISQVQVGTYRSNYFQTT